MEPTTTVRAHAQHEEWNSTIAPTRPGGPAPQGATRAEVAAETPVPRQPGLLTDADRVVVTVINLRQVCSRDVLSDLLGINPNSIGQAIPDRSAAHRTRPHDIPTTLGFVPRPIHQVRLKQGRPADPIPLTDLLADPTLTGMSRPDPDRDDHPGRETKRASDYPRKGALHPEDIHRFDHCSDHECCEKLAGICVDMSNIKFDGDPL